MSPCAQTGLFTLPYLNHIANFANLLVFSSFAVNGLYCLDLAIEVYKMSHF